MRRYNIVPLILLIFSIINFTLAAPALTPENKKVHIDVVRVPKDVTTVLGKRGGDLEKMLKLSESFDRWWGGNRESSSVLRPPSSSAPSESGHGSMQVHAPPANPVSSTEPDQVPESSSESTSKHSSMPSLVSASDLDSEAMGENHGAPPPNPESLIESGHSHTLPSSQVE